ncbi:MAG: SMR family transporter [Alistipes indistinctus]
MDWIYLILGGLFEMGWALGLKTLGNHAGQGLGILLAVVSMALSMFLLYIRTKKKHRSAPLMWCGPGSVLMGTRVLVRFFCSVIRPGSGVFSPPD